MIVEGASKAGEARRLGECDWFVHMLIPKRLGYIVLDPVHRSKLKAKYAGYDYSFFTSELHWRYSPFASDFGPVNLGIVYRFCRSLLNKMANVDGTLVYCIEPESEPLTNASFLLGAFLVLNEGQSPQTVSELFVHSDLPCSLRAFRDATYARQSHDLTIFDCLAGLEKAVNLGWFQPREFDLDTYEELEHPRGGDIHCICPKFVAFKGPLELNSKYIEDDEIALPVDHYARIFRRMGVSCIVRLNDDDTYDKSDFLRHGFRHHDLQFDDCSVPPEAIVDRFLAICAQEKRIAVHCRAGLGRTGTLIALWMMRHAGFAANEAIAWLRIVRPGSVIGPQQNYLVAKGAAAAMPAAGQLQAPTAGTEPAAAAAPESGGSVSSAELSRQVTAAMRARGIVKSLAPPGPGRSPGRRGQGLGSPLGSVAGAAGASDSDISLRKRTRIIQRASSSSALLPSPVAAAAGLARARAGPGGRAPAAAAAAAAAAAGLVRSDSVLQMHARPAGGAASPDPAGHGTASESPLAPPPTGKQIPSRLPPMRSPPTAQTSRPGPSRLRRQLPCPAAAAAFGRTVSVS